MITAADLNERMSGIQLAVFEVLWPAVPQLTHVYVNLCRDNIEILCEANEALSKSDRVDCERLAREIIDGAFPGTPASVKFDVEAPVQALEVMSRSIFERIAREVAPWRLEAGR